MQKIIQVKINVDGGKILYINYVFAIILMFIM